MVIKATGWTDEELSAAPALLCDWIVEFGRIEVEVEQEQVRRMQDRN